MRRSFALTLTAALAGGYLVTTAAPLAAAEKPSAGKTGKKSAAFSIRKIEGWTVYISHAALVSNKAEVDRALDHLANQLYQIKRSLPAKVWPRLQQVPIWLANGEKKLGIAFHPNRRWLTNKGYSPPKPKTLIGIGSSRHYLHESLRQPWLAFHELCHGYDWFVLGKQKSYGCDAAIYRTSMKNGKYVSALHWNGRMRKPYHASNKMEFFAETSEAFFGTNDIFPFVRAELREHDPETFSRLAAQWNVDLRSQQQTERELAETLAARPLITGLKKSGVSKKSRQKTVGRFTPTAEYKRIVVEGWTVRVNPALYAKADLAKQTLRLLRRD
ncbi:MAG: hypothetical protein IID45_15505, partial [Planctomycetes bacterium]|nr:hypothetical protein [Planctomycetota bacterium]